jgi:hypothetical protein
MNVTDNITIQEFLSKYYRPDRYTGRGEEYAKTVLASHEKHFKELGFDLISRHESVTGQAVWFHKGNMV